MTDIDHTYMQLPDWAYGFALGDYTKPNCQLCTRDGRATGNAVNVGLCESLNPEPTYLVVTDAGNQMKMTENEMASLFYPPLYLMSQYLPAVKASLTDPTKS